MESAITGLRKISRKRAVAFLLSGSVLIGVPKVLRELCGCECTIEPSFDPVLYTVLYCKNTGGATT